MLSLTRIAAAGLAAIALSGNALADTDTSSSSTISNTFTSWYTVGTGLTPGGQPPISDPSLHKFWGHLGNLTQVDVTIDWTAHLEYSVTSTVGNDQLFFVSDNVTLSALLPNGQTFSAGPPELDLGAQELDPTFGVYNPTGVLHGFETQYAGPQDLAGSSMVSFSTSNGDDLSAFIGSGNFQLPSSGIADFLINNNSGNITITPNTLAGMRLSIVYTYDTTVTPEPGTVALVLAGSAVSLVQAARRRRRRRAE